MSLCECLLPGVFRQRCLDQGLNPLVFQLIGRLKGRTQLGEQRRCGPQQLGRVCGGPLTQYRPGQPYETLGTRCRISDLPKQLQALGKEISRLIIEILSQRDIA